MSQKVLVLGGAGYIGSHAAKYLAMKGFTPVVYDNLSRGHLESVKYGPFEEGDIDDYDTLLYAMRIHKPVAVMHFAALAYVGESVKEPAKYYWNNVAGTINVLDCMRVAEVKNIIFSSSCATYGNHINTITESTSQDPINPYGAGKLMCERIIKDYGAAYGIRSVMLRYFNAAGADPDCEIGEMHDPETHLIPLAIEAALGGNGGLVTINGQNHPTPDGTCIRDYVHVWDLAQAHALALQYLLDGKNSNVFNLGGDKGHSVREVVDAIYKKSNGLMQIKYASRRTGDPASLVSNSEKARSILGWVPKFSSLDTIIETAWNWHSKIKISLN